MAEIKSEADDHTRKSTDDVNQNGCVHVIDEEFRTEVVEQNDVDLEKIEKLSMINHEINKMWKNQLVEKLKSLKIDTRGNKQVLQTRLKNYYRNLRLPQNKNNTAPKKFRYLCVVDFEATCDTVNFRNYPHEIIEFPAVLIEIDSRSIVGIFRSYCRPTVHPKLSTFCTELTGISQTIVDEADEFPAVLEKFTEWLHSSTDSCKPNEIAFVTDGPWDMSRFMVRQCDFSNISFPKFAKKWINVRKIFSNYYRCKKMRLAEMLDFLGLPFDGRQHCGLDDAKNIATVVVKLLEEGARFYTNENIGSFHDH